MKETELYKISCNNIKDILSQTKEGTPVSVKNDMKYRDLRKIILQQNKKIDEQASKIKILEGLVSKENNINLNNDDNNSIMNFFKNKFSD